MVKYAYLSFVDTYLPFYRGKTTKMLSLMRKVLILLIEKENFISDRLCVR
jgi:hypothetical protein